MSAVTRENGMMSFTEWREWLFSLPLALRLFVFLILIRPVLDNFYDIRIPFLSLSLLELTGVAVPAGILVLFLTRQWPPTRRSRFDACALIWAGLLAFNTLFWLFDDPSLENLGIVLKVTLVLYLFLFLRAYLRTKTDLHGIMLGFLYSAFFPAAMLLYEVLFSPIRIEMSRGYERIQGGYADVSNYGIYIVLALLISGYFYLIGKRIRSALLVILVAVIGVLGLYKINHVTSMIASIAMVMLLLLYAFSYRKMGLLLLILGGTLFFTFSRSFSSEKFGLIQKDVLVLRGEKEAAFALHGRVYRWQRMMDTFYGHNILDQTFGLPVTGERVPAALIGGGVHSDYLRILFTTGYLGLSLYLLMLLFIFLKSLTRPWPMQFLAAGGLLILGLFSVSAVPTLYAPLMYITLSLFVYIIYSNEGADEEKN